MPPSLLDPSPFHFTRNNSLKLSSKVTKLHLLSSSPLLTPHPPSFSSSFDFSSAPFASFLPKAPEALLIVLSVSIVILFSCH